MYRLKINITRDILEKSANCEPGSLGSNCAIALAIRDIFPNAWVAKTCVYPFLRFSCPNPPPMIRSERDEPVIEFEKRVTTFIQEFDYLRPIDRKKMDVFNFEIDVPDDIINAINIKELKTSMLELVTI